MLQGYISCLAVSVALHAFLCSTFIEDIQEGLRWNLFKLFKAKKHARLVEDHTPKQRIF